MFMGVRGYRPAGAVASDAMPSVLVAMSGGVDSSVAACLLAEQGYDVVGSHMSLVHLDGVEHGCCGPAARADAAEVARIGGFPFEICDLSGDFDGTRDRGLRRRARGRAHAEPVRALQRGDQVRRVPAPRRRARASTSSRPGTTCGRVGTTGARGTCSAAPTPARTRATCCTCSGSASSPRSLFPVGGHAEGARRARSRSGSGCRWRPSPTRRSCASRPSGDAGGVRALARRRQLVHAGGGRGSRRARCSATHDGTFAFTVGQRRGLGVATGERRLRASRWTRATNRVVVGPRELLSRAGARRRPGLVGGRPTPRTTGPFEAEVRIRYRGDDVPAVVTPTASGFDVAFAQPQRAVAPGQSVGASTAATSCWAAAASSKRSADGPVAASLAPTIIGASGMA